MKNSNLLKGVNVSFKWSIFFICTLMQITIVQAKNADGVVYGGELRKWHSISLTFDGPYVTEQDDFNPFLNYRLNVIFTHEASGKFYLVPGYFAADGNAANSSADAGNKWRVNFSADETGRWQWRASFRKNNWVAVSDKANAGVSAGFMDGQSGHFIIDKSNKKRKTKVQCRLFFSGKTHKFFGIFS